MKRKTTKRASKQPRELPVEVREPDKASKRLALFTIIALVIVVGLVGALLELFVAPLFATDVRVAQQHHAHAPITSELDFLIQMVPHHQEAVDTARLIAASTTDSELRTFAQNIITTQSAEIAQMNAWIDTWYPGQRYNHSYTPMMPDLERLSGATRDEAFLFGMIEHHQGAIIMAQEVQEFTLRPETIALASLIIHTQSQEIMHMQTSLGLPMDSQMHAAHH
jgi:uncharacterized protein (DUF305 family)